MYPFSDMQIGYVQKLHKKLRFIVFFTIIQYLCAFFKVIAKKNLLFNIKSKKGYYPQAWCIRYGMLLSPLFYQCLHIPYTQVGVTANFALQRKGRTLYIYFQASDGKNDWKNNLDFPAKPYKRMGKTVWFAHRGFLKVWKEIEPYLIQEIADTHYQSFVVVGYSHGAAIAALCHEYIWYNRPDARESLLGYGFGSPRVLWGICHKAVKNRWARYTVIRNENDFITHRLPLPH